MTRTPDLSDLTGKVAIVTGAASGTGRETARYFAAAGAAVVADWNGPGAETVAAELAPTGSRATAIKIDVSNEASVIAMMARVQAEFGRLNILVNNAACRIGRCWRTPASNMGPHPGNESVRPVPVPARGRKAYAGPRLRGPSGARDEFHLATVGKVCWSARAHLAA